MGTQNACRCSACGFNAEVKIGGSRSNYLIHSAWPILCRACDGLESTNLRREPLACTTCGSQDIFVYGEHAPARDWSPGQPHSVVQNFDWYIYDQDYPCPNCGAEAFRFDHAFMLFD